MGGCTTLPPCCRTIEFWKIQLVRDVSFQAFRYGRKPSSPTTIIVRGASCRRARGPIVAGEGVGRTL